MPETRGRFRRPMLTRPRQDSNPHTPLRLYTGVETRADTRAYPRRDSNPRSPAPEAGALSTELLRRWSGWIRTNTAGNQNPVGCQLPHTPVPPTGLEPAIRALGRRCRLHWATAACTERRIRTCLAQLRHCDPHVISVRRYLRVPLAGFEPAASRSVAGRSVPLSYRGVVARVRFELTTFSL